MYVACWHVNYTIIKNSLVSIIPLKSRKKTLIFCETYLLRRYMNSLGRHIFMKQVLSRSVKH